MEIGEFVDLAYRGFHAGMSKCWSNLYRILQDTRPATRPEKMRIEQLYFSYGSGTGRPKIQPGYLGMTLVNILRKPMERTNAR